MPRILPSPNEAVRTAEQAALDTARSHLNAARVLYDQGRWSQACFLAMTAIEELGKAMLLQRADAEGELPDRRELRDHDPKAVFGTVPALIFNDDARERHGTNPVTQLPRIEAVRYVAEGGAWMKMRNACLYVDCNASIRTVATPAEEITREHAYLMFVGALETLATILSPAFTYRAISMDADLDYTKEREVLTELAEFQNREQVKVDLDRLDIVASPERVEQLRRAVRAARERAHQTALARRPPPSDEPS
jgi:AbiV family abortive infection protein